MHRFPRNKGDLGWTCFSCFALGKVKSGDQFGLISHPKGLVWRSGIADGTGSGWDTELLWLWLSWTGFPYLYHLQLLCVNVRVQAISILLSKVTWLIFPFIDWFLRIPSAWYHFSWFPGNISFSVFWKILMHNILPRYLFTLSIIYWTDITQWMVRLEKDIFFS